MYYNAGIDSFVVVFFLGGIIFVYHIFHLNLLSKLCGPINTALNTAALIKRGRRRTLVNKSEYYRTTSLGIILQFCRQDNATPQTRV